MEYQRSANRELNELTKYAEYGGSFHIEVAIRLGRALVYALLDIAQSIREGQRAF